VEENLFMAEHLEKNHDKAPRSTFLLPAGKHRFLPVHPPDLFRKTVATTQFRASTQNCLIKEHKNHL